MTTNTKNGLDQSVQEALEARRKRLSSGSGNSFPNTEEGKTEAVQAALKAREERKVVEQQNFADSFKSRYENVFNSYNESVSSLWGKSATEIYDSQRENRKATSQLMHDVEVYRKYIGDDLADNIIESLEKLRSSQDAIYDSADMYAEYESEAEYQKSYDEALAVQKDREEKLKYNVADGRWYIDRLEDLLKEYEDLTRWEQPEAGRKREEWIRNKYGSVSDLKALISTKKAYLTEAERLQEAQQLASATGNEDFNTYNGYVSTITDKNMWDGAPTFGDELYEYINNPTVVRKGPNGERESTARDVIDIRAMSYNRNNTTFADDGASYYKDLNYNYLNQDEIDIFNYYYAKDGKETAQKYLDSLVDTLATRKARDIAKPLEGKLLSEIFFGVVAGFDQFTSGLINLGNTEDEYIAPSAIQYASGMVREDLKDNSLPIWYNFKTGQWENKILGNSLAQVAYDATTTTANMLPSIMTSMAVGTLNPIAGAAVGSTMMGASAAGNAYQEMLNLGYDKSQARAYSSLVGASEAGLQYLLGGIGKMGGKLSGAAVNKILTGVDNALARVAIQLGGSMISEGIEESLQEVLNPWFKEITAHIDEDVDWNQVAYSGLLGALSALSLEGPGNVANTAMQQLEYYNTGKTINKAGQLDALMNLANEMAGVTSGDMQSALNKQIGKVNKKATSSRVGKLYDTVQTANNQVNVSGILNNNRSDVEQRNQKIRDFQRNVAVAKVAKDTGMSAETINQILDGSIKTQTEEHSNNRAIQISTGQSITVEKIESVKNGTMTLQTAEGSKIDAQDVSFASPDAALVYAAVAKISDNARVANLLVNAYNMEPIDGDVFAQGIQEAYRYGRHNITQNELLKRGTYAQALTGYQRELAYKLGQLYSGRQISKEVASIRQRKKSGKKVQGAVHFDGDKSRLNAAQRAGLNAMELLAKALNVQFHVFESEVDANGNHIGDSGWYDPKDGSIHIDLYAGADGKGTMLFTVAHELTHYIRQWSPAKFKILANYLMEQYGKRGVSVNEMIDDQIAKAERTGRTIDRDTAFEELVADSMESMLSSGRILQALADIQKQDRSLAEKIRTWFETFTEKLKSIVSTYKNIKPDSVEGRLVADMKDVISTFEAMYGDALLDASENFDAEVQNSDTELKFSGSNRGQTQKNTADSGVRSQAGRVKYDYSKSFAEQIDDFKSGKIPHRDTLVVGATPKVYQSIGLNALPMTINATHVDYALNGTKDHDHHLGEVILKQLPDKLKKPIAIFVSKTQGNTSVVALLDFSVNGRQVVAPIVIDGFGVQNALVIDSNSITSVYGKNAGIAQLYQASQDEANGKFALLYVNKKEAISLLHRAGHQLSGSLIPHDGFYHSIREKNSPVKPKFINVTETQQFKRWFGDWKNHPQNASKVVNADGTPKVVYHGTNAEQFNTFSYGHIGAKTGVSILGDGFYFTDTKELAKNYGQKIYECYLLIKNP